eukprot:10314118-Karenia_brevis.AAC.1
MEEVKEPLCVCSKTAPSPEGGGFCKPFQFQFQLLELKTCRSPCACAAKQLLALKRVRGANPFGFSC